MPFALFGHSMGSLVAYELARVLRRTGLPTPAHLFVSGRRAPQMLREPQTFHDLPDARFIERLRELSGTPEEVLQHPELIAFVLPTLKADFAVCETYMYRPEPALECPISAFGGLTDADVSRDELAAWAQLTRGPFRMEFFPGGHFFLHDSRPGLLAAITADLRNTLTAARGRSRLASGA
jgi:medium-chain acyl-[acyl-carrier-protein] hydrolase